MDLDNLQQNMNTRVVFKEPRGMIRWLQLLFAIIAVSTVCDYYSTIGIDITCPPATATTPSPVASSSTTAASSSTPSSSTTSTTSSSSTTSTTLKPSPVVQQQEKYKATLVIQYPFDQNEAVNNTCPGHAYSMYKPLGSLSGSPQFFVMTGFLSLIYAVVSLIVYLLFSSTYDSIPVMPIGDLLIAAILCLFWFIASSSFSSGVSLLKATITYDHLKQVICPPAFLNAKGLCEPSPEFPDWKSLNVGLVSGFASFFLWGFGLWFVYKETHFHTPRGTL